MIFCPDCKSGRARSFVRIANQDELGMRMETNEY